MTAEAPEGHSYALVDWNKLHQMPTARILFLRPGDVLILPAGTYHYVYTSKQKLVVGAFPSHAAISQAPILLPSRCHLAAVSHAPIYSQIALH